MEMNEVLERLPGHLLDLVIDQPYNAYTAQDHALWRYVMRQNVRYLSRFAYGSYTEGLRKTGISIDRIPHMYGMNRILKEIGWAAVAVDGFIPPSAFMEFQAYNVLVIAADIRPIGQIAYTPAPDIIHEAAGHAPIIADPEYASYLRLFGEIGSKAFSSAADYALYEAIRHLSILKTDPYTPADKIALAEKRLAEQEAGLGEPSEMSLIRNLHWWTVEYGLIGDLQSPMIYGAGLLSSIGESQRALKEDVRKIPYDIEAVNYGFDITSMQPQLFVTPDFAHLTKVLKQFEERMAIRKGGLYGIRTAIGSANHATCVFSSGLQVSGIFSSVIEADGQPAYLRTDGPTTLNYLGKQLRGHGRDAHADGFGSPVGIIEGIDLPPEELSENDLQRYGIIKGKKARLSFRSGVVVEGTLMHAHFEQGKLLLLSFTGCTVRFAGQVLFEPSWGVYDMAVGSSIISCFSGPADPAAYGLRFPVPDEKTHKIVHTEEQLRLFELYQQVRDIKEGRAEGGLLRDIIDRVGTGHPDDWLLTVEIAEIAGMSGNDSVLDDATRHLRHLKEIHPEIAHLIDNEVKT